MTSLPIPLRRAARATGFAAVTAAMVPPFALRIALAAPSERASLRDRWVRRWSNALLGLFAIHARVSRFPPRVPGRGRLVVANHRSTIDVALLLRSFGGRMVSRADLAEWPIVGVAARSVGTIFVNRKSAFSGASTIRSVRAALQEGDTVCLFPEGTTFEGDEVRPFHAGAFISALRTGAEIVPVGIAYERGSGAAFVGEPFLKHLERMAGAEPTSVSVRIGDPFEVPAAARAKDLSAISRAKVQALVDEARRDG